MSDQKPLNSPTPADTSGTPPAAPIVPAQPTSNQNDVTFTKNDEFNPADPVSDAEPIIDPQREQILDIDSELKDGTPLDVPVIVVDTRPKTPAPAPIPAPKITPPTPVQPTPPPQPPPVEIPPTPKESPLPVPPIPQAPAPAAPPPVVPAPAPTPAPQAQVPPPISPPVPPPAPPVTQPTPKAPSAFVPSNVKSSPVQPVTPPSFKPVPPVVPPAPISTAPVIKPISPIKEPRSFASLTPLVMRAPVDVPTPPPQTPPPPPPKERAPIPMQQFIPGSPTPPAGTVTKQPIVHADPTVAPKPEEPKKLTVLEQLRAQTATVLHPLRTYQTDAQVSIRANNESLVSVAAAEENRKARAQLVIKPAYKTVSDAPQHHYLRTVFLVLGTSVLLAAGVGVVAYVLIPKTVNIQEKQLQTVHPIAVDESIEVPFGGLTHDQLLQFITDLRDKTGLSLGLMREIYFTSPTDTGGKRLVTVDEVMPRLAPHAPPELLRTLDAGFLVGVHVYDGNQGFILLKTNAYEQAFSAMLAWEPTMRGDFMPFLDRRAGPKLNSELTATATPAKVINSAFVDVVLKNHDARALYDDNGNIIFLYSFLDRNTILITTNDLTLGEVISRMTYQ